MKPDYEKMYYTMFDATEKAINLLIDAQRECEEIFMDADDAPQIIPLPTVSSDLSDK